MAKAQKAQEQARFQRVQICRFSGRLLTMDYKQSITQSASRQFYRIKGRYH